jgi:hypothetical protein
MHQDNLHKNLNKTINTSFNNHTLKGKEDSYLQQILNHMWMNWQPTLVVNYVDLITSKWQILGYSNNKFYCLQVNATMHKLNHNPTKGVYPMQFVVFLKIKKIKQIFVSFVFKHWLAVL